LSTEKPNGKTLAQNPVESSDSLDVLIMPPAENPVANCSNDGPLNSADNKKGYRTLKTIPRVKNCNYRA
jgi:hypothetical protein